MITRVLTITDMNCPNCAMHIEGIEDDLPGIRNISASYPKGQMTVEFDELVVSEKEILAAVERLGYHTTSTPSSEG